MTSSHSSSVLRHLPYNAHGRDFVVGDIHGMFRELAAVLRRVDFNTTCDRLIAVGDLVDRGRESVRALDYLEQPWFASIMGNHERMLLDAQQDALEREDWQLRNGGGWWRQITPDQQCRFLEILPQLPIAIEIVTAGGRVGVVHADIPKTLTWQAFGRALAYDDQVVMHALWSRDRLFKAQRAGVGDSVEGIDTAIFGHTPLTDVCHFGNLFYIDTGAVYTHILPQAKLSLLQIHPQIKLTSQLSQGDL